MNAEELTFADDSFDFIFGTGILHHLDLNRAYQELSRVLRPNGVALFIEPLGHNPIINAYRNRTPDARTDDEHPLLRKDLHLAREYFSTAAIHSSGLLSLAAVPFGNQATGRMARDILTVADKILLKMPVLRWQAWIAVLELRH
jgi:SAM-dependent methyltransferase